MNRERISQALSGISEDILAECTQYTPPVREYSPERKLVMGRYEEKRPHTLGRRTVVLILAACLLFALGITAYATGAVQSLFAKWANTQQYEDPDAVRESNPDYAQWIETQLETQEALRDIGNNMEQVDIQKNIAELSNASITLKEFYYDGTQIAATAVFQEPKFPISFDFDKSHPGFGDLEVTDDFSEHYDDPYFWESIVPLESQISEVKTLLEQDGHVGFTTYTAYISDHVYANDADLGCCHTDPDSTGLFYVEPYIAGIGDVPLPESCQDQSQITLKLNVRVFETHFYLDGTVLSRVYGDHWDYPVEFTLTRTDSQ